MICGVTLKDKLESTVIASRVGVDGRSVKRCIDVIEDDMRKSGVVQQDAGDREGWRRKAVKGLANPRWRGKFTRIING